MIAERYAPHAQALTRIAFTLIFLNHGLQKLLASGEMAVAHIWMHQFHGIEIGQGLGPTPTPVQNTSQAAVLFCFGFLDLGARGAGIWNVDAARAAALPHATVRVRHGRRYPA